MPPKAKAQKPKPKSKKSPPEKRVREELDDNQEGADGGFVPTKGQGREVTLLRSKLMSPSPVGIVAMAVRQDGRYLAVARDDSSILLFNMISRNNSLHFCFVARTGGQSGTTITRLVWTPLVESTGGKGQLKREPQFLLASTLAGQILVFGANTLAPVCVIPRSGGSVYDMCFVGMNDNNDNAIVADLLTANSDGCWRQFNFSPKSKYSSSFELFQVLPKIVGGNRALCVAAEGRKLQGNFTLIAGCDDVGQITAWNFLGVSRRGYQSLWTTRLPSGFAMALQISSPPFASSTVVAGTSTAQVVFIDGSSGIFLKLFSHHKGPVTCLLTDHGSAGAVAFASGWHESLRAYRNATNNYQDKKASWKPAEVKRRTHYHEATALCLQSQVGASADRFLLSASKDGTIMFCEESKLFSRPASYVDVSMQAEPMCSCRHGRIVVLAPTDPSLPPSLEGYTINANVTHWIPLFKYALAAKSKSSSTQNFFVKGLWAFDVDGPNVEQPTIFLAIATDVSLKFVALRIEGESFVNLNPISELQISGVSDVSFARGVKGEICAFVAALGNRVVRCAFQFSDDNSLWVGEATTVHLPITCTVALPFRMTFPGALFLYGAGESVVSVVPLLDDGVVDVERLATTKLQPDEGSECPILSQFTMSNRGNILAHNGRRFVEFCCVESEKGEALSLTLSPVTTSALPADSFLLDLGDKEEVESLKRKKSMKENNLQMISSYLGHFSRGILGSLHDPERQPGTLVRWELKKRIPVKAIFPVTFSSEPSEVQTFMAVERNLEGTLERLPEVWKVRRFGN